MSNARQQCAKSQLKDNSQMFKKYQMYKYHGWIPVPGKTSPVCCKREDLRLYRRHDIQASKLKFLNEGYLYIHSPGGSSAAACSLLQVGLAFTAIRRGIDIDSTFQPVLWPWPLIFMSQKGCVSVSDLFEVEYFLQNLKYSRAYVLNL